jgi:hypothetical protein
VVLELLAIVYALKVWRHYLVGRKIEVRTDHCGLQHIFTQGDLNARQRRWSELLSKYDFEISYIKGTVNRVADALSRRPRILGCCLFKRIYVRRFSLYSVTMTGTMKSRILSDQNTRMVPRFEGSSFDSDGLLRFRGRIYVGLPLTARRNDSIFVVIDTLTKSAHFIPVRTTYQAPDIVRVFISEIVRLRGVPKKIISD